MFSVLARFLNVKTLNFCQWFAPIRLIAKMSFAKDATLFYHDRRKFFRLVGLASAGQSVFWVYLAYFQYSREKLFPKSNSEESVALSRAGFLGKIVSTLENRPISVMIIGVTFGMFFSFTGWFYCLRNINRLVLLSSGNSVQVVTHTPLGGTRSLTVALTDISCLGSRLDTKTQLPLQIRGYKFFFLVDKDGIFLQPTLFDNTVGVKRKI